MKHGMGSGRDTAFARMLGGIACMVLASACSGALEPGTIDGDSGEAVTIGATTAALDGLHPLGAKKDAPALVTAKKLVMAPPAGALPASVNLTNSVPPPGDQGSQGSCVGWAVGYAAKSFHEVTEEGWPRTKARYQYSPSWVYNQINGGVDQGSYISDALDLLVNDGADTLQFFPYSSGNFTAQPDSASTARAGRFKANSWSTLSVNATTFKQVLAGGNPIVIGMQVMNDFDTLSASNPIYDTAKASTDRGRHAVTLIGYDDAEGAFRLINSWGTGWGIDGRGWLAYNFISNSDLAVDAYVLTDKSNAEPPVANSLYGINSGKFHRVDNDFGDWKIINGDDWSGDDVAVAALSGSIYAIQNQHLHRVNPTTGSYTVLGGANWIGPVQMTALGSSLYVAEGDGLWTVNPTNGAFTRLGTTDWTGTTSLTSYNGSLYAIQASHLHKINPSTGSYTVLGGAAWPGSTTMAAVGSSLYVTQDDGLWKVNPTTGAYTRLGTADWTGATTVTALNGKLYIVQADHLHEVEPSSGAFEVLGPGAVWGGTTVLAALP